MQNQRNLLVSLTALLVLSACASKSADPKFDYQSENKKIINLEVPPDLNDPRGGDLYTLPQGVTASPDALKEGEKQTRSNVLGQVKGAHIERSGTQRWLVVDNKQASEIWPLLRAFWQENGFTIYSEEPRAGLMETDWAENRAKLASQGLRKLFDKIGLGSVYSTSERDKFLIRIEHNQDGGVDIFFTHRGLEEVFTNKNQDTLAWQPRASDPNIEAAFLARFMQYLGVDEAVIQEQMNKRADQSKGTEFAKMEAGSVIVYGDAQRNVNRVASALDRIGLTVQQFVPERAMFVVRPAQNEVKQEKKPGLFSRLFGSSSDEKTEEQQAPQMFVALQEAEGGQRIFILNQFGKPYEGKEISTWLNDLYRELR